MPISFSARSPIADRRSAFASPSYSSLPFFFFRFFLLFFLILSFVR